MSGKLRPGPCPHFSTTRGRCGQHDAGPAGGGGQPPPSPAPRPLQVQSAVSLGESAARALGTPPGRAAELPRADDEQKSRVPGRAAASRVSGSSAPEWLGLARSLSRVSVRFCWARPELLLRPPRPSPGSRPGPAQPCSGSSSSTPRTYTRPTLTSAMPTAPPCLLVRGARLPGPSGRYGGIPRGSSLGASPRQDTGRSLCPAGSAGNPGHSEGN